MLKIVIIIITIIFIMPIIGLFLFLSYAEFNCHKRLKAYQIEEPKKQIKEIEKLILTQKDTEKVS